MVFAIVHKAQKHISLYDYFRMTPETELHKAEIGVWTSYEKESSTNETFTWFFKTKAAETSLSLKDFNIYKFRRNWTGYFLKCLAISVSFYKIQTTIINIFLVMNCSLLFKGWPIVSA